MAVSELPTRRQFTASGNTVYPTFSHTRRASVPFWRPPQRIRYSRTYTNCAIAICYGSADKLSRALYVDQMTSARTHIWIRLHVYPHKNPRAQLPIPPSEGLGRLLGTEKTEIALKATRVPKNSKLANVAPLLRSNADA